MLRFLKKWVSGFPVRSDQSLKHLLRMSVAIISKALELHFYWCRVLTATIAILEVTLFSVMGQLVDWLINKKTQKPFLLKRLAFIVMSLMDSGWPCHWWLLWHSAIFIQTYYGITRCELVVSNHIFCVQSMFFFRMEIAGRISHKVGANLLGSTWNRDEVLRCIWS